MPPRFCWDVFFDAAHDHLAPASPPIISSPAARPGARLVRTVTPTEIEATCGEENGEDDDEDEGGEEEDDDGGYELPGTDGRSAP